MWRRFVPKTCPFAGSRSVPKRCAQVVFPVSLALAERLVPWPWFKPGETRSPDRCGQWRIACVSRTDSRAMRAQRCRMAIPPQKSGLARSHPTQSFMQGRRGEPPAHHRVILSNDTERLSARGRGQSTTVHSIYKLCFISDADICAGCAKLKNGVVGWGSWRK